MPKFIPWDTIRKEYEEIGTSIYILAKKFECSATNIYAHAKVEEWKRAEVGPNNAEIEIDGETGEDIVVTQDDLNLAVTQIALYEAKKVVVRLLKELDRNTAQFGELDRLINDETSGDINYRRKRALRFVSTLGARALTAKNLAAAIKSLADFETQVEVMENGGKGGKKESLQNAAERLTGKFDIPEIDIRKAA